LTNQQLVIKSRD